MKYSPNHNNINLADEFKDEAIDDNMASNKYLFERDITHENSQLMKSPSMGSIKMDYKEKTAEFEGEDLAKNQISEKKKPTNRPVYLNKNKFTRIRNIQSDDMQVLLIKKNDIQKLTQFLSMIK